MRHFAVTQVIKSAGVIWVVPSTDRQNLNSVPTSLMAMKLNGATGRGVLFNKSSGYTDRGINESRRKCVLQLRHFSSRGSTSVQNTLPEGRAPVRTHTGRPDFFTVYLESPGDDNCTENRK